MRKDFADWKHRAFRILAAICVLALFSQPETWHMLFLSLEASTLDVLALLLEVQAALVIAVVFRTWLLPVAVRTWDSTCEIGRVLRYGFFLTFVPGSQDLAVKWGGPLAACIWLGWAARDSKDVAARGPA